MSDSASIYEGTKRVKGLLRDYTFLTEQEMAILRDGGKVDVETTVANTISHDNDEYRWATSLLNVAAAEAASEVDQHSYLNDDGETVISWDKLVNIDLFNASYVFWKRDYASPESIPEDERVKEGMTVRAVIEMDSLPDGSETLSVVSMTARRPSQGMNMAANPANPDNSAPSAGRDISDDDSDTSDTDEQDHTEEPKSERR